MAVLLNVVNGGSAESQLSIDLHPSYGAEELVVVSARHGDSAVGLRSVLRDLLTVGCCGRSSADVTDTF